MVARICIASILSLVVGVQSVAADQLDLGNPVKREPAPADTKPVEPVLQPVERKAVEQATAETTIEQVARLQTELRELKLRHARVLSALRRAMPLLERAAEAGHLRPAAVTSLKNAMGSDVDNADDATANEADDLLKPSVAKPDEKVDKPAAPAVTKPPPPLAGEAFAHVGDNIFARRMKLVKAADGSLRLRGEMRNLTFKPFISVGLQCAVSDADGEATHRTLFYVTFSELEQIRSVDVELSAKQGRVSAERDWTLKVLSVEELR